MVDFKILGSGITRTIANIYGPSAFPQKQDFIHHPRWLESLAKEGRWIVGGYFNLITTLKENKGGRRVLDKYQEEIQGDSIPKLPSRSRDRRWLVHMEQQEGMGLPCHL